VLLEEWQSSRTPYAAARHCQLRRLRVLGGARSLRLAGALWRLAPTAHPAGQAAGSSEPRVCKRQPRRRVAGARDEQWDPAQTAPLPFFAAVFSLYFVDLSTELIINAVGSRAHGWSRVPEAREMRGRGGPSPHTGVWTSAPRLTSGAPAAPRSSGRCYKESVFTRAPATDRDAVRNTRHTHTSSVDSRGHKREREEEREREREREKSAARRNTDGGGELRRGTAAGGRVHVCTRQSGCRAYPWGARS